jgi:hypothetical protein
MPERAQGCAAQCAWQARVTRGGPVRPPLAGFTFTVIVFAPERDATSSTPAPRR